MKLVCESKTLTSPPLPPQKQEYAGTVDYLLHSSAAPPVRLLGMPSRGALGLGLPNECHPSDHLALLADFSICGATGSGGRVATVESKGAGGPNAPCSIF